jgi:hypothetical protein
METLHRVSIRRTALLLVIGSGLSARVFGQGQSGQITGVVTDSSGGGVPGAKVIAINESTAIEKATTTNAYGNYTITPLMPATYKVTVSKPGFKSSSLTGIKIDVAEVPDSFPP